MQDRLVRFTLFGQEFAFYSDADDAEVDAVVTLLRQEFDEGKTFGRSSVPSSKILVLGCLRMAAKYIHAQREHDQYRRMQEKVVARLLEKILSVTDTSA